MADKSILQQRHTWTDGRDAFLLEIDPLGFIWLEQNGGSRETIAQVIGREILNLAEENERLRDSLGEKREAEGVDRLIILAAEDERARVRRELLAYLLGTEFDNAIIDGSPEHAIELLRSALDRICPEEG